MNRTIKILFVGLAVLMLLSQDSYAFWGRKKKVKKAEEKKVEEKVKVEEKAMKKAAKSQETKEVTPGKQQQPAAAEPQAKKKPVVDQEKIEKDRLKRQEKRKKLNNTTWTIELAPLGKKGREKKDVLVFKGNRFYSEQSSKDGFSETNYTITVKDDDVVIWETMQTADEGKVNFWRGELTPEMQTMRGIISKQFPDGKSENYSFVSTGKKIIKK